MIPKTIGTSIGSPLAVGLANCFLQRASDVKEALLQSRRYRAVIELCPLPTFISEPCGECDYVNPAYEKLVGVPAKELLGNGWLNFIHVDDRMRILETWRSCIRERRPYVTDLRIVSQKGVVHPMHVVAKELPGKSWVGYYLPIQ